MRVFAPSETLDDFSVSFYSDATVYTSRMLTAIHRRVAEIERGEYPYVICKLHSGWLVAGEVQVVPAYCLLLSDPVVGHLNELQGEMRTHFLADMARIGDALIKVTDATRINYEILGNLEPALHAHFFPRFDVEAEDVRTKPVWLHDWDKAPKIDLHRDKNWMESLAMFLSAG